MTYSPDDKPKDHPEPNTSKDASTVNNTTSLHYSLLGPSLLKAGQTGVDQNKVGEIIYEASKGSKFFKHEEHRDEQLTKRIEQILKKKAELEAGDQSSERRRADEQLAALEKTRDLSQVIVHVDCDAFFASVEELDRPELKTVPMAVGGGVLTTCNYKAREFGVRSGMAGHIAKKICPQLVFIPINGAKYAAKAEEVRDVLVKYDERYEAASVDEAFLNITEYLGDHPEYTSETLVEHIRKEVLEASKISISAGIGSNAKIAKIASNKNKPNGQFLVPSNKDSILSFMHSLPVRTINGVGRVFERELQSIGITLISDIYTHRSLIRPLFGEKATEFLLTCYLGLGRTQIRPISEYERKSVGTESTFRDLWGHERLRLKLRSTAEELERDLKKLYLMGRTVVLKAKLHTYQVHSRQTVCARPVWTADDLYNTALPLLQALEAEFSEGLKLRLMGLRVTNLVKKRDAVDIKHWFSNPGPSVSGSKRQVDADGWEVWPEEEFEARQEEERQKELRLTQELDEHLEESERQELSEKDRFKAAMSREDEHILTDKEKYKVEMRKINKEAIEPDVNVQEEKWDCPICLRPQAADDATFNQHVDFCLSKQAIREAVQETSKPPSVPAPRSPTKRVKVFVEEKVRKKRTRALRLDS